MFGYPWFGMPYYNRYSRYGYRYPYSSNGNSANNINVGNKKPEEKSDLHIKNEETLGSDRNPNKNSDAPLFELFGISLYFDDILIICLILFLYNEGVEDESLFICLIMLLFS